MYPTLIEYLDHWATQSPNDVWLREPHGENLTEWTWSQVQAEVGAIAAWQESFLGGPEINVGLLSSNRAHWFMADLGTIAAGNVTIPMFITLPRDTAEYVTEEVEHAQHDIRVEDGHQRGRSGDADTAHEEHLDIAVQFLRHW